MKLILTIGGGSLEGQSFELENGFLTIGRGETCSIRFDPLTERIASKQHAFIEAKPDGYYLTDNQSTNGTLLNGAAVTTAKLSSGDQIQFGRNGVTANVTIEAEDETSVIPKESFREMQLEQFNQLAATGPVNLRNSISNIGLGSMAAIKPEPDKTGTYIGIGVGVLVALIMVPLVFAILLLSLGPVAAVVATIVAFLPAIFYIIPLIWLDRYDPEPSWLIAIAFGWGSLVAIVVSFVVNSFVDFVLSVGISPVLGDIATSVISAPVFEEGTKGIGVILILVVFRKYFDDILDGIVFAGIIALGFATVENVLYYGRVLGPIMVGKMAFSQFGLIFLLRGILSPFAHVMFTAMTGIGCGIARESHKKYLKFLAPVLGYFAAVALHATWNGFSMVITALIVGFKLEPTCQLVGLGGKMVGLCGFFSGYIVLEIPLFLIIVGFTIYILRRQRRILNEMLAIDIARGLIPADDADKATHAIKSTTWLLSGLLNGKFMARSRYMRAIGKLGLSYWHIQRATAAHGQTASFQQNPILREEVLKWRDQV